MPGLNVAGQDHRGDDGSPDPAAAAALTAYADGRAGEDAALAALAGSRLLIPVVALRASAASLAGSQGGPSPAAPAQGPADLAARGPGDAAEMALPSVIGADGRAALPAFTCLAALQRWQAQARPVPMPAARVWQAALEEASAVVIDIAGPVPLAVEGARLAALAAGQPVPAPHDDPDVLALAGQVVAREPLIAGFRLLPGDGTDLTLAVRLAPGAPGRRRGQRAARLAAERAATGIVAGTGGRFRRGVTVAVTAADT